MSYTPTTWSSGDLITSAKLNKIEQGLASASELDSTVTEIEGEVTELKNDLDEQINDLESAFTALGLSVVNGAINITY